MMHIIILALIILSSASLASTTAESPAEASRLMNNEKYEQAEKIYSAVLSQDAENAEALKGIDDARIMLKPYMSVQHLIPPPEDKKYAELDRRCAAAKTPWDIRRAQFAIQKYCMQYTADMYKQARTEADEEVKDIIKAACDDVKKGEPPKRAFIVAQRKIREVQNGLNRNWKGSGPRIFEPGVKSLQKTFDENGWVVP